MSKERNVEELLDGSTKVAAVDSLPWWKSPKVIRLGKLVLLVALFAILYQLPHQYPAYQVGHFNQLLCFAIAAMGLNLLTGYGGQISLGHAAFFGVGAYTVAIGVGTHGWPHALAVVVAAIVCFGVGIVIGIPALRIKGLYLALVTLSLTTIFPQLIKRFSSVTGGTQGKQIRKLRAPEGIDLAQDQWRYYVFLIVAILVFLVVRNIVRSRPGRALIAARDNETAAEVLGVNLALTRVMTFGLSAMFAGIGGALFVFETGQVNANEFSIQRSLYLLVIVVLGGVATLAGPIVGAFFLEFLPTWLPQKYPQLSPVTFGIMLIVLMLVAPGGLVGLLHRLVSFFDRQRKRLAKR